MKLLINILIVATISLAAYGNICKVLKGTRKHTLNWTFKYIES